MSGIDTLEHATSTQVIEDISFTTGGPPVRLFQGVNSVSGNGRSTAVTGEHTLVGGMSEIRYQLCQDTESLAQTLNITQSANVGLDSFGFSEKIQFLQNTKQTSFSLNIVVYARHVTGAETAFKFSLEKGISPPRTDEEKKSFFESYGDSFVSSISSGSEYYAVYSFYAGTLEEQQNVKLDLATNGIFEGGSFDADFQANIESALKKTKVHTSLEQMVTGLRDPKLPKPEHVVKYALKFTSIEPDAPTIIAYSQLGYEHVRDFGDFEPIPTHRAFFFDSKKGKPSLCDDLLKINGLSNSLNSLMKTYSTYGGYDDKAVVSVLEEATSDLDTLRTLVSDYDHNPLGTFEKPTLTSLTHGSPRLQFIPEWSPSWGGSGGVEFDDVNLDSFIQNLTRLTAIQLRSYYFVDNLLATYSGATGAETIPHGGGGGALGTPFVLLDGERITEIKGSFADYVVRLSIYTNLKRSVSGGGVGGDSTLFSWSVPDGSFLLGFRGSSGVYLDRIQAVCITFKPAAWEK